MEGSLPQAAASLSVGPLWLQPNILQGRKCLGGWGVGGHSPFTQRGIEVGDEDPASTTTQWWDTCHLQGLSRVSSARLSSSCPQWSEFHQSVLYCHSSPCHSLSASTLQKNYLPPNLVTGAACGGTQAKTDPSPIIHITALGTSPPRSPVSFELISFMIAQFNVHLSKGPKVLRATSCLPCSAQKAQSPALGQAPDK